MTTKPITKPITFVGQNGQTISAKLELPLGEIKAFALFAHCL